MRSLCNLWVRISRYPCHQGSCSRDTRNRYNLCNSGQDVIDAYEHPDRKTGRRLMALPVSECVPCPASPGVGGNEGRALGEDGNSSRSFTPKALPCNLPSRPSRVPSLRSSAAPSNSASTSPAPGSPMRRSPSSKPHHENPSASAPIAVLKAGCGITSSASSRTFPSPATRPVCTCVYRATSAYLPAAGARSSSTTSTPLSQGRRPRNAPRPGVKSLGVV